MNPWAITLASVAIICLIIIPLWGVWKFSPRRARNVKYVEQVTERVQQHVTIVTRNHPEIIKLTRLDRHPFFILPHMGVWGYALCVFGGAQLTSNVNSLSDTTRFTMATCFMLGATLVLTGASLGVKIGPFYISRKTRDHPTVTALGDDIVLPYRLSTAGLGAVSVAMGIYAWTSFQSTPGSLGGWLTATLAAACALTAVMLWRRIQSFEKQDSILIAEALARMEIESDAAG